MFLRQILTVTFQLRSKFALIILLLLSCSSIFGQENFDISDTKVQRVKNAYGFLLGQEYSMSIVKSKFPNLSIRVSFADDNFNSVFGVSKERMKDYLTSRYGQELVEKYFDTVLLEAKKMLGRLDFTEEFAVALIDDVHNRTKGFIPSPILETILHFKYSGQPEMEFNAGYTQVFKTKGHSKSKGTDWQIKVPKSWKQREGDRPNIIQKFVSDFGDGQQSITLQVRELDLPDGYNISNEEIEELFTEKEMRNWMDEKSKYLSFTKMTFDSNPGGMFEYEEERSRLDLKIKIRMVSFMFIRKNAMYFLQASVGTGKLDSDLSLEIKKYLPLFRLVANSIVVNDQYHAGK